MFSKEGNFRGKYWLYPRQTLRLETNEMSTQWDNVKRKAKSESITNKIENSYGLTILNNFSEKNSTIDFKKFSYFWTK